MSLDVSGRPVSVRQAADVATGKQWMALRPLLAGPDHDGPAGARRRLSVLFVGSTDTTLLADMVTRLGRVVTGIEIDATTVLRGSVEEAMSEAVGTPCPAECAPDVVVVVPGTGHEPPAGLRRARRRARARWAGAELLQVGLPLRTGDGSAGGGSRPPAAQPDAPAANHRPAHECAAEGGTRFVDVDRLRERLGPALWWDRRFERLGLGPVSLDGLVTLAREIIRALGAATGTSRRVLATDLDNTFWGGVLGESGPEGIVTGDHPMAAPYVRYQRFLEQVRRSGVEVVVVSKNEPEQVRAAFAARQGWAFGPDDFARVSCGWEPKSVQLSRLAGSMHLSLDKFILVDDNPFECDEVAHRFPQVDVVRFDPSTDGLWPLLEGRPTLPPTGAGITEADAARAGSYRALARAEEEASAFASREEFLSALDIQVDVAPAAPEDLARVHALVQKTNQMNVTLRRATEREVAAYLDDPTRATLTMRCTDRYADHGLTGFTAATVDGETARLDFFCMSCRVLGRDIERLFLHELVRVVAARGVSRVLVDHRDGGQNVIARRLLDACGFLARGCDDPAPRPGDRVELCLDTGAWPPDALPDWLEGRAVRHG